MKFFSYSREDDYGVEIRLHFFIFSSFTFLTLNFRTTDYPSLIPYLQFTFGGVSLLHFVIWIHKFGFEFDFISKSFSIL